MPSQQPPDPMTDGTFPDFPPRGDLQNTLYLFRPRNTTATLIMHFRQPGSETSVLSAVVDPGSTWNPLQLQGMQHSRPDRRLQRGTRPPIIEQWGYSNEDRGKPPDFVLETASAISPIWPELPEMPELPDLREAAGHTGPGGRDASLERL